MSQKYIKSSYADTEITEKYCGIFHLNLSLQKCKNKHKWG